MADSSADRGVQLMLAFQAGDEAAFGLLVEEYQATVFNMLRRILGPQVILEDLAQEAFLRLYRARERYRPDGRLSTFLFRITYNLALNRIRDEKRHGHASLTASEDGQTVEPEDGRAPHQDAGLDQEVWAERIDGALAELPENQRVALVLQHYDGLDLAEIGQVLGISAKAVKSLLHRARENLRTRLSPYREAER